MLLGLVLDVCWITGAQGMQPPCSLGYPRLCLTNVDYLMSIAVVVVVVGVCFALVSASNSRFAISVRYLTTVFCKSLALTPRDADTSDWRLRP